MTRDCCAYLCMMECMCVCGFFCWLCCWTPWLRLESGLGDVCLLLLLSCRSWFVASWSCQSCLEGALLFIDSVPACRALSPVCDGGVVSLHTDPTLLLALFCYAVSVVFFLFLFCSMVFLITCCYT